MSDSTSSTHVLASSVVGGCSSNIGLSGWDGGCLIGGGDGLLCLMNSVSVSGLDVFSCLSSNIFFSFGVVNNLGFNWEILDSFPGLLNWLVFDDGLFDFLGDVFNLSFNSVVVGDGSLNWDSFVVNNFLILNDFPFKGNSLDPFNLVVLDVFLLERNVFDSTLNWDFFSNCPLDIGAT